METLNDIAKRLDRFVAASDALINAQATCLTGHQTGTVRPVDIERLTATQREYEAAREALVGPIDADQPEEPHNPL